MKRKNAGHQDNHSGGTEREDRKEHNMTNKDEPYKIKQEAIKLNPNVMKLVWLTFIIPTVRICHQDSGRTGTLMCF